MKLLRLAVVLFLGTLAFACSDDDDNNGNGIKGKGDNKDGEVQIEKAVDALKKETNLSTFTEALEKVDGSTLTGKEFTLLAYKNQKEVKSTKADDANILRHMIEGKYTEKELLDKEKLQAVSKDTLYFGQDKDGAFTINNVKVGKSITSGNSIIFVVDSIIPVIKESAKPQEQIVKRINTIINNNADATQLSATNYIYDKGLLTHISSTSADKSRTASYEISYENNKIAKTYYTHSLEDFVQEVNFRHSNDTIFAHEYLKYKTSKDSIDLGIDTLIINNQGDLLKLHDLRTVLSTSIINEETGEMEIIKTQTRDLLSYTYDSKNRLSIIDHITQKDQLTIAYDDNNSIFNYFAINDFPSWITNYANNHIALGSYINNPTSREYKSQIAEKEVITYEYDSDNYPTKMYINNILSKSFEYTIIN